MSAVSRWADQYYLIMNLDTTRCWSWCELWSAGNLSKAFVPREMEEVACLPIHFHVDIRSSKASIPLIVLLVNIGVSLLGVCDVMQWA